MKIRRLIVVGGACVWSACTGSDGAPANSTGSAGTTGNGATTGSAGTTGNGATAGGAGGTGGGGVAPHFSFFMTSQPGLARLANNSNGFGGDLRFGQAADLVGARQSVRQLARDGARSGPSGTVGALGGYGGFYCLALTP